MPRLKPAMMLNVGFKVGDLGDSANCGELELEID